MTAQSLAIFLVTGGLFRLKKFLDKWIQEKRRGEECPRNLPALPKEPEPRQSTSVIQVSEKYPAVTSDLLIAGRLQHFLSNWKEITNDKVILDIVSGYKLEFTSVPSQNCVRKTFANSTQAVY